MKNLIIVLMFIVSDAFAQNLDPFCISCENKKPTSIADIWLVSTVGLNGNPVAGQFHRLGANLKFAAMTTTEIDSFIADNGDQLRIGSGNYFVTSNQNGTFSLLLVERVNGSFIKKSKSIYETIENDGVGFMFIIIPHRASM